MCFDCHGGSEADNLNSLKYVKRENYPKINSTAIGHMLIHLSGSDGENVHDAAAAVLKDYLKWYDGRSRGLWQIFKNPHDNMFPMPYVFQLEKWIDETERFYNGRRHLRKEEIANEYKKFTAEHNIGQLF